MNKFVYLCLLFIILSGCAYNSEIDLEPIHRPDTYIIVHLRNLTSGNITINTVEKDISMTADSHLDALIKYKSNIIYQNLSITYRVDKENLIVYFSDTGLTTGIYIKGDPY